MPECGSTINLVGKATKNKLQLRLYTKAWFLEDPSYILDFLLDFDVLKNNDKFDISGRYKELGRSDDDFPIVSFDFKDTTPQLMPGESASSSEFPTFKKGIIGMSTPSAPVTDGVAVYTGID
jgi:hypothetical protein